MSGRTVAAEEAAVMKPNRMMNVLLVPSGEVMRAEVGEKREEL